MPDYEVTLSTSHETEPFIDATLQLSPIKARSARTPILIEVPPLTTSARTIKTLSTGYVLYCDIFFVTPP